MAQWLLVETFGPADAPPTVIGVGDKPRNGVPLPQILHSNTSRQAISAAIDHARRTGEHLDHTHAGRRLIAHTLRTFAGAVHGVHAWTGAATDPVPPRPPAGAWQFNLTTDKIAGSDDLLDLYRVPAEERRSQRNTAEAFGRLITNTDESAAMAKIVQARPGTEHRATWTVRTDDGDLRAAHFTCRTIAEPTPTGDTEVVLRGITHDVGPAVGHPSSPPPMILAQQVLAGMAEPGTSRALINLRTLTLIRWIDDHDNPAPTIAWRHTTDDPIHHWIHPDDHPTAHAMVEQLVHGKADATLRFRTTDHQWQPVYVTATLVLLDSTTTAALFTLHEVR